MKTQTHTPGPWVAYCYGVHADHAKTGRSDNLIASTAGFMSEERSGEAQANASLIAAAPELLEALYEFEKGFRDGSIQWTKKRKSSDDPYHPANVKMCEAIAKAEGR